MNIRTILILLLLIIIILWISKYNENYDGRIRNVKTIEDCADIASSIYGVTGFGYNDKIKNCYISKTFLTRPPIQNHPYHNDFNIDDKICNKFNFILGEAHQSNQNNLIANRLYLCFNNNVKIDDNVDLTYFERNNKARIVKEYEVANLPYVKQDFFRLDYPKDKEELNDIGLEIEYVKTDQEEEIKNIKNIRWMPAIIKEEIEKNPLDLYDDKNNLELFKIKKNTCYDGYIFNNTKDLDKFYPKISF